MAQFQAGNRQDLVDKESAEIALLQGYMPSQLQRAEIDALIARGDRGHRRGQHQGHGQGDGPSSRRRRRAGPTWPPSARKSKPSSAVDRDRSMAGRIPQPFIDEIVARSDIVEIIGARVALKKSGREYKACCPFHSEKTPSFWVSPDKQFYHCFGCGAHGTVVGFLMQYEKLGFLDAVDGSRPARRSRAAARGARRPRPRQRRSVRAHDPGGAILRAESGRQPARARAIWRSAASTRRRARSSRWATRPTRGTRCSTASEPTRRSAGDCCRPD